MRRRWPSATATSISVSRSEVLVAPGATRLFESSTGAVNWSATGGTISANGLFTAGLVEGEFEVKATSRINGVEGTAVVEVSSFDPTTDADVWSWADPHAMGLAQGEATGVIGDASGNNNGFVQFDNNPAKFPVCRKAALNGLDVLEGDGIDDLLDSVNVVPFGERTTFVVTQVLEPLGHPYVFAGGWERLLRRNAVWKWYQDIGGAEFALDTSISASQWIIAGHRLNDATSLEVFLNNAAPTEIVPTSYLWDGIGSNQTDRLFAHSLADCCKCQIAGYLTILRALSDVEMRKSKRWFNSRFGVYNG